MKEKLSWSDVKERYLEFHKMAEFTENMAIDIDFGYWLVNNCIKTEDISAEVEKRIAERMPTMEESIEMATEYVNHKSLHKANRRLIRDAVIIGINMVRSRMTDSQNTEGGGK